MLPKVPLTPDGQFISQIVLVDVDPDHRGMLDVYREVFQMQIGDAEIVRTGKWAEDDRKFFFDNPLRDYRIRDVDPEERLDALESLTRGGVSIDEVEKDRAWFQKVLVASIVPGVRCRAAVDRKDRAIDRIVIPIPVMPFGMVLVPLLHHFQELRMRWAHTAAHHNEKGKPH
jgi:hypothetical protein